MKKILLLFCGGTISMSKNTEGALEGKYTADQLFDLEPRVKEIAKVDVEIVDSVDSTNINHIHWEKLADLINKNYSKYNGFIITHGTNTLGYTSSALSFALQNVGKPVVLTGAQIPAEKITSDARNNFVNALRVSTMDLGGVFTVFGSKIILGCRTKKVSESELEAFKTFNDQDFGEIRIGIKINKSGVYLGHKNPLKLRNGFEDNIICITLVPGLKSDYLIELIEKGIKGIVLRAFGSGDIPYDLLPALKHAKKNKVPVVATTQCPTGATIMGINDPGLKALEEGVIQAFDMSMESMTTKLMWLLKQGIKYEEIKDKMHKNIVGEINTDSGIVY